MTAREPVTADATTPTTEPTVGGDDRETPGITVVTSAYNEAGNLGPLFEEIDEVMRSDAMKPYLPYEVIVVDDGSTDSTRDIIHDWANQRAEFRGVYNRRSFGQSAALKAGIDHAQGDILVTMDADRQNDPKDIPALVEKFEAGYHCVSGWRRDRDDPWHKTIPSAIQTPLAKLTGPDINDFGCTLKVYDRDALAEIDLYGEGHRYIPSRLHKLGYDIAEVEVNHRPREAGQSAYGAGRLLRGLSDLVWHVYWTRYSARPNHLLGVLGMVMLVVGGGVGGHAAVMRIMFGSPVLEHLPRLLAAVGLVILGIQLLGFALVTEMLTKMYYRDEEEYRVERLVGFD